MFEESMVNVLIQQICAKSNVHITSKLENDIIYSMLSVRDIEIIHLQVKILNSRGFSIKKHVNKRLTVTSNDKFEVCLKTSFSFHRLVFCLAINMLLLEITILKGEGKYTLLGPIIIYYLFYFICHTIIENELQII